PPPATKWKKERGHRAGRTRPCACPPPAFIPRIRARRKRNARGPGHEALARGLPASALRPPPETKKRARTERNWLPPALLRPGPFSEPGRAQHHAERFSRACRGTLRTPRRRAAPRAS